MHYASVVDLSWRRSMLQKILLSSPDMLELKVSKGYIAKLQILYSRQIVYYDGQREQ